MSRVGLWWELEHLQSWIIGCGRTSVFVLWKHVHELQSTPLLLSSTMTYVESWQPCEQVCFHHHMRKKTSGKWVEIKKESMRVTKRACDRILSITNHNVWARSYVWRWSKMHTLWPWLQAATIYKHEKQKLLTLLLNNRKPGSWRWHVW